jgi:transposase-like protein
MKKRHSAEQIVALLRQADVALGKGEKVPEVCKQLGISEQTYYRWRTKYGGMDPQMARQLQELQELHRAKQPVPTRSSGLVNLTRYNM